jgi:surfactin synthase thioesterase subunit
MPAMVDALFAELGPLLHPPYAFFGHSLGAWVAYELAARIVRQGRAGPAHLFVSAAPPPGERIRSAIGDVPDDEFIAAISVFDRPTAMALESPLLRAYALPVLRADMQIVSTYVPSLAPPLDCPLTVFGGWEDPIVPVSSLGGWQRRTAEPMRCVVLGGDHFFVREQRVRVCREILRELCDGAPISSAEASIPSSL